MHAARITKAKEIEYPESDGKPMAETDLHRDWMVTTIQRLANRYRGRRVYVSGNLLIYYQEGDARKCVAPDAFVVKNCASRRRRTFLIWKEKRRPSFVLETTSRKTRREDAGKKTTIYAELRIPEYFLYDPTGDWLKPERLRGFRLEGATYVPIVPDADGSLRSAELGVRFVLENGALAMFDVVTGVRLLSDGEAREAETTRADEEKRRADGEKRRADEEKLRADTADQRAKALEAELIRLRDARRHSRRKR
jgi:Uma2 family endonuclease